MGFLALAVDPDLDGVTQAANRLHLMIPVAAGDDAVMRPFGVRSVPDTIFLDASGRVVAFEHGPLSRARFTAHVQALLGTAPQVK